MKQCQCGFRRANGEGTIYFNTERNIWIAQFTYTSINGEKKRKSVSADTKTAALKKKAKFLEDNAIGIIPSESKITLEQILKSYIDQEYAMNLLCDSSYERKLYTLSIIQNNRISKIPVAKIKDSDIEGFLKTLVCYANSNISKIYYMLNRGFKLACENRIIVQNPMDKSYIRKPKSNKPEEKVRAFTVDEQNRLFLALTKYKAPKNRNDYHLQLLIALYTGMRMGEINGLKKSDIDFKNNVIHIRRTVTRGIDYDTIISNSTKTDAGVRDIPLNPYAKKFLLEAVKNAKPNKNNLLFSDINSGRPISTSQVNSAFKRICEKANIEIEGGVHQHMLRHTFATRCIESGVPAEVLQKWLGHTDISTTVNTYCDVFSKMHDSAIEQFVEYSSKMDFVDEYFSDDIKQKK